MKGLEVQHGEIVMFSEVSTGVDSAGGEVNFRLCLCDWLDSLMGCG